MAAGQSLRIKNLRQRLRTIFIGAHTGDNHCIQWMVMYCGVCKNQVPAGKL